MSKRYPGGIIRKTPQTPSQTSAQGIWDMASVTQAVKENTWPIAGVPDPISRSLRFRASASAYLSRTFGTPTSNTTWTFSFWNKRGILSTHQGLISAGTSAIEYVASTDTLRFYSAGPATAATSTAVYRDPSAWGHWVITSNGTTVVAYYNNVSVLSYTGTLPQFNSAIAHNIGRYAGGGDQFDGYMTEVYLIDGQALTPSSFGNTNDQTGVWQPIAYTGTYGTNGFYLPFSNTASTSTLGNDFSGNSNNWTTNNISLTSGVTYDSMVDVPTQWIPYNTAGDTGALYRGNYCVINPIDVSASTVASGNLNISYATNSDTNRSATFGVSSGKWYWETTITAVGGTYSIVGITSGASTATPLGTSSYQYSYISSTGNKFNNNSSVAYGATYTTGDVIGVALDMDAGTLTFYKNNLSQGTAYTGLSGTFFPAFNARNASSNDANFGQRPFAYAPPSGFVTLNTRNLPTPTIGATASTTANKYFDVSLYTGTGATQTVTNSGSMQPDFVWTKSRSNVVNHILVDAVRGGNKILFSDLTIAEQTASFIDSFNSNGWTVNSGAGTGGNQSGYTYVGWQWRASNATAVTNTAGSITSTVSANTSAGFSIVTYTANGAAAQTIGHGLGVVPAMVITKCRSAGSSNWGVYHQSIGNTGAVFLNTTNATVTSSLFWNNTTPTSTVFSVGTNNTDTNFSTNTMVAYCFAQVAGYSAFGSYTGNLSSDGPFIYLGFKPAFVMIKSTVDSTRNWSIWDNKRDTYNVVTDRLLPNDSSAEIVADDLDFLSNGFKIRRTGGDFNLSGSNYIYMAFAESPFKYALAR